MLRCLIAIVLLLAQIAECRVKFTFSSLYDEFDFIGKTSLEIEECSVKCNLYVSVLKDEKYIDVYDRIELGDRTRNMSLLQLSWQRKDTKEIDPYVILNVPAYTTFFYNYNEGLIAAPLVIYAVDVDKEPTYKVNKASVFDAADISDGVNRGNIVTILNAHPFTVTVAGDKLSIATIFATGFDNADSNDRNPDNCRRVMQTRFDDSAIIKFQINGPITSIFFSELVNTVNNIKASLEFSYDNLELTSRGFVTSQGFIGCDLYQDLIEYQLFNKDSHDVHLAAYVNTDNERALSVHTDMGLRNFLGNDLVTPEDACFNTHSLDVYFNQSDVNSFSLVYYYSNVNCAGEVVVPSTTTIKSTTLKIQSTTGKATTITIPPIVPTTTKIDPVTTEKDTSSTTIGIVPTTSSTFTRLSSSRSKMTRDNIIFISYGVPLVALYILTIVSIVSIRSRLSSTCFYIYLLSSAVNLITYFNGWSERLYQEQIFNFYYHFANWTVVLPFIHQFLAGFCFFAQNTNSALLTWHRYWWGLNAVLYALRGIGYFVIAGYYDWGSVPVFTYIRSSDIFVKEIRSFVRIPYFIGMEAIFGIIFIVFCTYLNIATWIRLRHLESAKKADHSFFFISLTIFISQSVNIALLVLSFYFYAITYNESIVVSVFTAMLYTSDVFSLGPGLYMLIIPGPIRRQCFTIIRSFLCKSKILNNGSHSTVAQMLAHDVWTCFLLRGYTLLPYPGIMCGGQVCARIGGHMTRVFIVCSSYACLTLNPLSTYLSDADPINKEEILAVAFMLNSAAQFVIMIKANEPFQKSEGTPAFDTVAI
ncbi:hypothetical protein PRIPAC_79289 [Pristionchus pacificus]|uniref:Serpentine receptor class gamma n=1 Tax=Pristionchus pacificus TaxID=54126 RepID=A0A2A6C2I5_PRIPA|nr:hypothetical protein PRIPAC_79289 [Pristionchus pacificus]|eukprot:PDM72384.1 G protein-coupled receptor [Pristionchus pacificus]